MYLFFARAALAPFFSNHRFKLIQSCAVIAYKVRENLTVDGKKLTLEAADASTWVRDGDGWKCALHTESVLGDPYGRDRKPVTKAAA